MQQEGKEKFQLHQPQLLRGPAAPSGRILPLLEVWGGREISREGWGRESLLLNPERCQPSTGGTNQPSAARPQQGAQSPSRLQWGSDVVGRRKDLAGSSRAQSLVQALCTSSSSASWGQGAEGFRGS